MSDELGIFNEVNNALRLEWTGTGNDSQSIEGGKAIIPPIFRWLLEEGGRRHPVHRSLFVVYV